MPSVGGNGPACSATPWVAAINPLTTIAILAVRETALPQSVKSITIISPWLANNKTAS
jgi:hypothetical protein|tara:strand:+ start:6836 stop:7009 length:174 start_codon:yes stop_codon:yes gene_type:complete